VHIIGTAGHVDHGKSTLIAALTGVHPDRLKEEVEREMTIELGFASLQLPNGELVGIVDTPGHRDFIGNMLAGIGGIDAVLLVIAADEGVAAQTREHLAILDLLQIQKGIIVITKTDLVNDPEWLELVELEARELVRGTSLRDAPLARVSAKTGAGLPELLSTLEEVLADTPIKPDYRPAEVTSRSRVQPVRFWHRCYWHLVGWHLQRGRRSCMPASWAACPHPRHSKS